MFRQAASRQKNSACGLLIGSPETIRQRLAAYEAAGVQELVIHLADVPQDATQLNTVRRFAREFIVETLK